LDTYFFSQNGKRLQISGGVFRFYKLEIKRPEFSGMIYYFGLILFMDVSTYKNKMKDLYFIRVNQSASLRLIIS